MIDNSKFTDFRQQKNLPVIDKNTIEYILYSTSQ